VLEKLVENWLDSASERSYQPAFCQMLLAEGHTVLHSTRHAQIEFGKDVISIAPHHAPCAFQLKGNPAGRLTLAQFDGIRPQIMALVTQPIVYPGISTNRRHRSYLVTNGEIDEEVHRAVDDLNRSFKQQGYGADALRLWSRGRLLEMATRLGSNLWPAELENLNSLLELLVHSGGDQFPHAKFHNLLTTIYSLAPTTTRPLKRTELQRRIPSAALLTATSLRNFVLKENHWAAMTAWTMFAAYTIAALEKHRVDRVVGIASIALARVAIRDALASLCTEVENNRRIAPSGGLEIGPIYRGRATLIYALMSLYWLWCEEEGWPIGRHREFLSEWIPKDFHSSFFWGEGCVPQVLAHYWYMSRADATCRSEIALGHVLNAVTSCCLGEAGIKFPSPYFGFEDVLRCHLVQFLKCSDPLQYETAHGLSYFAEPLLHLLVRTNFKTICQSLWPKISRLRFEGFRPERRWQYAIAFSDRGRQISVVPPLTKQWQELLREARDCRVDRIPPLLARDPFLLLLFVIVFPWRATAEVVRYLGWKLGTVWLIDPPIRGNRLKKTGAA
jgi:hypothetical protein